MPRRLSFIFCVTIFTLVFSLLSAQHDGMAQARRTQVECGTILETELTSDNTSHYYTVDLSAGDSLTVEADPIGQFLDIAIAIYDPMDTRIARDAEFNGGAAKSAIELSATGIYTINIYGHSHNPIGVYTVYVGCSFRDGTIIAPGDAVPLPAEVEVNAPPAVYSGFGFPGLAPVDFSAIIRIPLIEDVPLSGIITPTGNEIIGFTTEAEAQSILDLSFTRLSGNLNLGITVLSPDNDVEFQVSLITSDTFSTQIALPATGEYLVSVFRIELNPPENPEGTAFQVQMQLK